MGFSRFYWDLKHFVWICEIWLVFGRFGLRLGNLADVWEILLVFGIFAWDFKDLAGNSGNSSTCRKIFEHLANSATNIPSAPNINTAICLTQAVARLTAD